MTKFYILRVSPIGQPAYAESWHFDASTDVEAWRRALDYVDTHCRAGEQYRLTLTQQIKQLDTYTPGERDE